MDLLTGLYNRGTGTEKIEALIEKNIYGAFAIIDIDNFKRINDTYGHTSGDAVLQAVSNTIKKHFQAEDIPLRMGGDEFAVYAVGLTTKSQCESSLDLLFDTFSRIKSPSASDYTLSISLGWQRALPYRPMICN